jgi:hypothetical protein
MMTNIESSINQHNSWRSKSKIVHMHNKNNGTNLVHDVELCGHIIDEYANTRRADLEKTISAKALVHSQKENSRIGMNNRNKSSGLKSLGHLYTLAIGRTVNKFGEDCVIRNFNRTDKLPRSVVNRPDVKEYFQAEFRNIIEELISL